MAILVMRHALACNVLYGKYYRELVRTFPLGLPALPFLVFNEHMTT